MNRFADYAKHTDTISPEVVAALKSISHTGRLCDLITINLPIDPERKQEILDIVDIEKRVERVIAILQQEIEWMQIDSVFTHESKKYFKRPRKLLQNQKLKAIQQELGDEDEDGVAEAEKLKEQVEKLGLPADSKEKVLAEVNRLRLMPPMSAEST